MVAFVIGQVCMYTKQSESNEKLGLPFNSLIGDL